MIVTEAPVKDALLLIEAVERLFRRHTRSGNKCLPGIRKASVDHAIRRRIDTVLTTTEIYAPRPDYHVIAATAVDFIAPDKASAAGTAVRNTGVFDHMVAWRDRRAFAVPLADAIAHNQMVDPADSLVAVARGLGIVFGDEETP